MSAGAERIVNTARAYVGVKESPPDSNNVAFNTAYYGRQVSGPDYPWCCVFVWYVFREAGLDRLFYGGGKTASCTALMSYAKKNSQFCASGFKRGDLALFNWSGNTGAAQHIGIISEVRAGSLLTIEGNTAFGNDSDGGAVMERQRPLSVVIGAYRPAFEEETEMDTQTLKKELSDISGTGGAHSAWSGDAIAELTALGIFKGDGEGNYGWEQLVTREALAQVVCSLMNILKNGEMK